jgi:hypothetical protein
VLQHIGRSAMRQLAAATIAADDLSAGEFPESLTPHAAQPNGAAVLRRALEGVSEADRGFFFALCEQPTSEARIAQIAASMGQREPPASAKLFR